MKPILILAALISAAYAIPQASAQVDAKQSTLTYTATSTVIKTATVTGRSTVYTTSTYIAGTIPYCQEVYNSTSSILDISTSTVTATKKPSSVAHAPTSPGFTPLKSKSYYTDKISIIKTTVTSTTTTTYDPSPVTTLGAYSHGYYFTSTGVCTTYSVAYTASTTIVTVTESPKSYTSYAACKANNIASKIPTGQPIDTDGETANADYEAYNTATAEDCCTLCQSNPLCFGGSWETQPFFGTCFIYTVNTSQNETCDGSLVYGGFASRPEYDPRNPQVQEDFKYGFSVFNGPCGQMDWNFDSDTYFEKY